jgi:hypothetical protein
MRKKEYDSPQMEILDVKLEKGFMKASIVDEDNKSEVKSEGHEVGETFDFSNETSGWE